MTEAVQFFVLYGVTESGATFRPSDWAERLAGILAPFCPTGLRASHISYSPYAVPTSLGGVRAVIVDERLRELEPLAWKFVHDFARDNGLKTSFGDHPQAH
jgi:hypothetical protein